MARSLAALAALSSAEGFLAPRAGDRGAGARPQGARLRSVIRLAEEWQSDPAKELTGPIITWNDLSAEFQDLSKEALAKLDKVCARRPHAPATCAR